MIDNLLGNRTNILVLRFLTKFYNQFFPKEEIVRETGAGLRNINDSLLILTNENILEREYRLGKIHYRFVINSSFKEKLSSLFEEERKRIVLRSTKLYKTISEIESKIIKVVGVNLLEILLFGSVAKGRDTANSDIDICVIVKDKNELLFKKIRSIQFDEKFENKVQLHVFTSYEFIQGKDQNPLIRDIIRDGVSLKIGK